MTKVTVTLQLAWRCFTPWSIDRVYSRPKTRI